MKQNHFYRLYLFCIVAATLAGGGGKIMCQPLPKIALPTTKQTLIPSLF